MNKISIKYRILTILVCAIVSLITFNSMPQNVIAEGIKVGVVDINEIFDKYSRRTDLDQELKDIEAGFKKEIGQKEGDD